MEVVAILLSAGAAVPGVVGLCSELNLYFLPSPGNATTQHPQQCFTSVVSWHGLFQLQCLLLWFCHTSAFLTLLHMCHGELLKNTQRPFYFDSSSDTQKSQCANLAPKHFKQEEHWFFRRKHKETPRLSPWKSVGFLLLTPLSAG